MRELGRIFSRRRLALGLLLIFLLNGFLFVREQVKNDYGLDLELPSSGFIFVDGTFMTTQEPVDAWAAYQRYSEWLDRARKLPLADAVTMLTDEKAALSAKITGDTDTEDARLDYVAVTNLLSRTDYLTGYGDWLENIQKNKENLLTFSIFNDPDSFSGRNILKTADEFEKLQGVELTLGTDGAVDSFMSFRLTDYFLLLVLLLVALSFLEERKAGLWSVVHAAPNGRFKLAIRRTLILFGASVAGVLLLYGTDLALGFSLYGGFGDLDRAVQSVETLGRLPMLTTVGGFLVRFFLLRIAAAFLVSLLLWLMLTAINNVKYTIIVAAGVLAVEYSLYTFLPVQSAFNIFKYFNLFTYISLSDLYTNYLNIDIFTYPLGIRSISQLALIPLCLLLAAVCVWVHCHKKPAAGRDLLGRVAYGINSVTDKFLRRLHLFGMELPKTLWIPSCPLRNRRRSSTRRSLQERSPTAPLPGWTRNRSFWTTTLPPMRTPRPPMTPAFSSTRSWTSTPGRRPRRRQRARVFPRSVPAPRSCGTAARRRASPPGSSTRRPLRASMAVMPRTTSRKRPSWRCWP